MKRRDLIISLVATAATAVLLAGCGGAGSASAPANSSGASSEVSVGSAGRASAPAGPRSSSSTAPSPTRAAGTASQAACGVRGIPSSLPRTRCAVSGRTRTTSRALLATSRRPSCSSGTRTRHGDHERGGRRSKREGAGVRRGHRDGRGREPDGHLARGSRVHSSARRRPSNGRSRGASTSTSTPGPSARVRADQPPAKAAEMAATQRRWRWWPRRRSPGRRRGGRSRPGTSSPRRTTRSRRRRERFMAKRAHAHTVEVKSSHDVMVSHPAAVTKLILDAVRGRSS